MARAKIESLESCWEWQGLEKPWYGRILINGKSVLAHRLSWLLFRGRITTPYEVAHNCDNPKCLNPFHLKLALHAENMSDMHLRGRSKNGNTLKTHCKRGHEFTPENSYWFPDKRRACRACGRIHAADSRRRK